MTITRLIAVVLFLAVLKQSTASISLDNFYPYGEANGDDFLAREDDAATSIGIDFPFPFFGRLYRNASISTNGIINFGSRSSGYVPQPFPLQDFKSVAAYWTDSDPSRGGNISYSETTDPSTLARINNDIRSKFTGYSTFSSKWALIVTFDRVSQFGCVDTFTPASCSQSCSHTLMYQTILTSDGKDSFAIFLYNSLSFTSGTANCGAHAQIGFNAGDRKRFYIVPGSNTLAINTTALTMSNVGVPGQWMFAVEGSDISEGCNTNGKLEIYPRKTLFFGREDITLAGPCFGEGQTSVTVDFGGVNVTCQVLNRLQIRCVAPYMLKTGSIFVILTYQNILYSTFLMVVDSSDSLVIDSDSIVRNTQNLNEAFEISWDSSWFGGNSVSVAVRGYQVDTSLDASSNLGSNSILDLNFDTVENTGRLSIQPKTNPNSRDRFIRQIYLILYASSNRLKQIVREITISTATICESQCRSWHNRQPSSTNMNNIVNMVSTATPCAPAVPTSFPQLTGNFEIDKSCNPNNPRLCTLFHPGAQACYRSINSVGGYVAQCCYDKSGRLMLGPPGGGTLDFADSKQLPMGLIQHILQDVIPYLTCCKCASQCTLYYEKRPSIDSRLFRPPGWGNGGGDPHFKTIDGTEYTFNPVGEFDYLVTDTDRIQVRISQFVDENDNPKSASYFSAFAIRGSNSDDVIQVELNELDMFRFRVNGEVVNLEYGTWNFDNISLSYSNQNISEVRTASSLGAEFHINGGVLNVFLSIPESAKGKVSGLVGNWDGNNENDFQLRDGTTIPVDSPATRIHSDFGMSWTTTSQTSIFSYPTGLSWSDYQDPTFAPDYRTPPENSECNGNTQCNYDTYATGQVCVGLANVYRSEQAEQKSALYTTLSNYCPLTVTVNNGNVEVNEISETHVVYKITCNGGRKMSGKDTITCMNGQYEPLPTCKSDIILSTWLYLAVSVLLLYTQL